METNNGIQKEIEDRVKVPEFLLNQLYNRPNKELFLKEYLEDDLTRTSYCVYLNLVGKHELMIEKDLADWSADDILNFFANQMTTSHSSLRAQFSISKQYCNFCVGRGINTTGTNKFATLSFKKDVLPMLNMKHYENKFLTEEQVWAMENESINAQDTVCLIPLFYGIRGSRVSELQKLLDSDIDSVYNTIRLTDDDGSVRVIEISPRLVTLFRDASNQSVYNRRGKEGFGGRNSAMLHESDFVIRPTTINGDEFCSAQTINTRCKKLLTDCGHSELSVNDVYTSGKLSRLKKIKDETGEITVEDLKKIQFDFNDNVNNYSSILETFLLYEKAISKAE